ncbi:hypothetical protein [Bradyrhizobium cajani]|nr:hypothetical protein [Bradyrhizobium cajani]MCP3367841.1 hypothetical protein [Bradyrhizobium cajani]
MLHIHHILPQSLAGHFTLKVLGNRFSLNGIKNLMGLPSNEQAAQELGSSPHTGGHLGSYSKIFCKFLGELQAHPSFVAAQEGNTAAVDQLDAELSGFLGAAKHALAKGHLLANTPLGMTPENANKRIEDWYANWRTYANENRDSIQHMQDTADRLYTAGQREGALRVPLLFPDATLSLADRIAILERYRSSPHISQHFAVVGPVPDLPGLVAPVIDARLPGFIPPSPGDLNRPEGFSPSPHQAYGLPGFPAVDPQGFGQLPPTPVTPRDPLVLRFDPATGAPQPFSGPSPILDPDPPSADMPPPALYGVAGIAALGAAAPELLPLLGILGAIGSAGMLPARAAGAESSAERGAEGVFSSGTTPYNAFASRNPAPQSGGSSLGLVPGWPAEDSSPEPEHASTFADRFGSWTDTPAGTQPAQPSNAQQMPDAPAAGAVAPEEVRRLTRVNASNASNVFTSGTAPVPYLPSTDRFGNWIVPTTDGRPPPTSKPIGAFADEPSYLIPPPIFGVDGAGNPHNDAEEWFSRWIRPLIRSE